MIWLGALCCILGADRTPPQPFFLTPPAVETFLQEDSTILPNHRGYLKELARRPDLAESEAAWWRVSARPGLDSLSGWFEEVLGSNETAEAQFDAFYDQLVNNPDLRNAVENLLRTELDLSKTKPDLARAFQFLRANPDLAMRFLQDPDRIHPLPEPLQNSLKEFRENPEQMAEFRERLGEILNVPGAHEAILPWWEQLESLTPPDAGADDSLETALNRQPAERWLWHLRNINLARQQESRPWIRYWSRLIHREPTLAKQYGPFVMNLLQDPELLRNHLSDLEAKAPSEGNTWPPAPTPPRLPPLDMTRQTDALKRGIQRPDKMTPQAPSRPTMAIPNRPERPTLPAFPDFPKPGEERPTREKAGPRFPDFPTMPRPEIQQGTPKKRTQEDR